MFKARRIMIEFAEEAARVKAGGLKSRNERIKQASATEIMDRTLGKPVQKTEQENSGETIVRIIRGDDD